MNLKGLQQAGHGFLGVVWFMSLCQGIGGLVEFVLTPSPDAPPTMIVGFGTLFLAAILIAFLILIGSAMTGEEPEF